MKLEQWQNNSWRVQLLLNVFQQLVKYNLIEQLILQLMLPDNYPVFNIDLDCDFQSSDNKYPPFQPKLPQNQANMQLNIYTQQQNLSIFSTIGLRKDNLDRCERLKCDNCEILAVFDGHCDPEPVDYLRINLLERLSKHPKLLENPQNSLLEVFQQIQRQVIKKYEKGSTALVLVVLEQALVVANLGDCKLFGINSMNKTAELTISHNLTNKQQLMEVINRGGIVLKKGQQYRINGELNLSRSFGDRKLKSCMSSRPDIYRFNKKQYKRWVIASDGFYNADNLQQRLRVKNVLQLKEGGTIYRDNASAIYLDF